MSLVVHVCALSWLMSAAPTFTLPSWRLQSNSPLILEVLQSPVPVTQPIALPPQPFPWPKRRARPIELAPRDVPPERPDAPAETEPHESDSPRVASLTPRGEENAPDNDEGVADQQRVSSRVGAWLAADVNEARARGGLLDPEYRQLGDALRAATDGVPRFIDTNSPLAVGGALVESWAPGAEKYGKTGAAYSEPEGRREQLERPVEAWARASPEDAHALAQFLAAGARLQEFADGRAGLGLFALVELKQLSSGALASARLLRPSGLTAFDAWVLERSRQVALEFSVDGGTRARPLRSVWRFDGVVIYRRKLSSLDGGVGRAAVGLLTMAALSALSSINHETREPGVPPRPLGPRMPGMTGRFDEKGSLEVIDLTNPTYDCTIRLMEAD